MFCTKCGHSINANLKFCTNCGTPVKVLAVPQPVSNIVAEEAKRKAENEALKRLQLEEERKKKEEAWQKAELEKLAMDKAEEEKRRNEEEAQGKAGAVKTEEEERRMKEELNKKLKEVKNKKSKKSTIVIILLILVILIGAGGSYFIWTKYATEKEQAVNLEKKRVEQNIMLANQAIVQKNYESAMSLINNINWEMNPESYKEYVAQYNTQRENMHQAVVQLKKQQDSLNTAMETAKAMAMQKMQQDSLNNIRMIDSLIAVKKVKNNSFIGNKRGKS